ncbi:BHLH domain-containing protein [Trichonephila inaurata madagascariensis]|uniref:BHLH domain-containing protein n=1 Tax=Trichonephila inaurata madagascariensis TaxID=2747483 RepID=A0A8X6YRP4_9ARAC|nr:BHLH domain-containing protein [Trichonephila inaurata madagascariensis]
MEPNSEYMAPTDKRRASKPLIERRRRERINKYLSELVKMVSAPGRTSENRTTRMQKAQILEMTVDYVRKVQENRLHPQMPPYNVRDTSFQEGYQSCVDEIYNFIQKTLERGPSEERLCKSLLHYLSRKHKSESSSRRIPPSSTITSSSNFNEELNQLKSEVYSSTRHKVFEKENNVLNSGYFKVDSPITNSSPSHSLPSSEDDSISNVYELDCSMSGKPIESGPRVLAQNNINNNINNNIVCNTEPNAMWRPW